MLYPWKKPPFPVLIGQNWQQMSQMFIFGLKQIQCEWVHVGVLSTDFYMHKN